MKIPFSYTLRNLWARKLTTVLTAGGMALVVFVFATVLMLEEGLRKTLVETGSYDNVVVIRRSAQTEVQSAIDRVQAALIESQPEVAFGADGERMVSKETIVLVNLNKRDSDKPTNVMVRGVAPRGLALRPQVKITAGRMFRPGSSEIVAGRNAAERFKGRVSAKPCGSASANGGRRHFRRGQERLRLRNLGRRRPVDAGVPAADLFGIAGQAQRSGPVQRIEDAPGKRQRLTVEAKRETIFYADQSEMLAKFIRYLGLRYPSYSRSGAIIGAMITMYASSPAAPRK